MGFPAAATVLAALFLSGCAYIDTARHWVGGFSTGADVTRISNRANYIPMTFAHSVCGEDPYVDTSVWMTDIPSEQLTQETIPDGQILHVEMLFQPRAGWTPIDSTATNLSIRYIIIVDGQVGIYEGGGFGYPVGTGRNSSMTLSIEQASLDLTRATDGFVDLLSPAELSGTFSGPCDTTEVERIRNIVNQHMTNTFGQVIYVQGDRYELGGLLADSRISP
ncbi:MAG: hypothetical protein CMJ40_10110 [Phycisphaerae bacterium]|nr:hypothetical protein [Phycisphaerae bacterium]|tara:strand:- start:51 stop:713 length:663 start_codon:yes stop_codon:yes gene_type:complete